MTSLLEAVARTLYFKSLERDHWRRDDETEDEKWETAKALLAIDPVLYERPRHAFEDAAIAISVILGAIAEPSEFKAADTITIPALFVAYQGQKNEDAKVIVTETNGRSRALWVRRDNLRSRAMIAVPRKDIDP